MREVAKIFKALSDETRLRILNLLIERECCVCEVMQVLELSQTRASRNLGVLYDAGLLRLRKEGLWSLYSINDGDGDGHLRYIFALVREALRNSAVAREDRLRLKQAERLGPPGVCRTRRQDEIRMNLAGKKVIVVGEKKGINRDIITECIESIGAHPVITINQCFV